MGIQPLVLWLYAVELIPRRSTTRATLLREGYERMPLACWAGCWTPYLNYIEALLDHSMLILPAHETTLKEVVLSKPLHIHARPSHELIAAHSRY